jgi:peptidoglycan/LPS O-acetylase OafA/YrhL
MNKKLNILESVRGGAALYVFLGHFIIQSVIDKTNHYLFFFKFGQEAVILFFLMSGFVIQLSYRKKQISFFKYFKKRFFRIYPLFLVSIILVVAYKFIEGLPMDVKTLVGNLFMLQDMSSLKPGTIVATYGNSALWSLSYEWWFYILFIPISRFKNKNTVAIVIVGISALLYIMYPIQIFRWLMYFGIWWSGVMLANFYLDKELNFKNIFTKIIIPALILPFLFLIFKALTTTFDSIGVYPVLEIRHFASAILFILIAFIWKKTHWLGYNFFKPLEQIAPCSYGLYVLHLPVIMIFQPIVSEYIENSIIQFIIIGLLVVLISFLLETRFQEKLNSVLFKKSSPFLTKQSSVEEYKSQFIKRGMTE